jgi:hypothetical protein
MSVLLTWNARKNEMQLGLGIQIETSRSSITMDELLAAVQKVSGEETNEESEEESDADDELYTVRGGKKRARSDEHDRHEQASLLTSQPYVTTPILATLLGIDVKENLSCKEKWKEIREGVSSGLTVKASIELDGELRNDDQTVTIIPRQMGSGCVVQTVAWIRKRYGNTLYLRGYRTSPDGCGGHRLMFILTTKCSTRLSLQDRQHRRETMVEVPTSSSVGIQAMPGVRANTVIPPVPATTRSPMSIVSWTGALQVIANGMLQTLEGLNALNEKITDKVNMASRTSANVANQLSLLIEAFEVMLQMPVGSHEAIVLEMAKTDMLKRIQDFCQRVLCDAQKGVLPGDLALAKLKAYTISIRVIV